MEEKKLMKVMENLHEATYEKELQFFLECGMISEQEYLWLLENMKKKELKKYTDKHPYKIYLGKNGYWTTYLPLSDGKRKKISKKTKEEVLQIVAAFWMEDEENPTIGELFLKWNYDRLDEGNISERSFDRYESLYSRHFKKVEGVKIKESDISFFISFLKEEKKDKKLDKKGFASLKTAITGILEMADDMGNLPFDYLRFKLELDKTTKKMKYPMKAVKDEEEVFTEEEYALIVPYLCENMDAKNTAILLMFLTGMRIGEVVALKKDAILENSIRIDCSETRYKNRNGKGYIYTIGHPKTQNGYREVVLPQGFTYLYEYLKGLNSGSECLFVNENGKRYTAPAISRRLNTVCKRLGIKPKSPHKIRKTVGTIYFDANIDKKLILDQMGWSSEAVGETHYHRNRKSIDKKINIISNIPEFQF